MEGMTSLDPRFIQLQRASGWYFSAAVSVGLLIAMVVVFGLRRWYWGLLVWTVGSIAVAWFCYWWAPIEYRYISYGVDEDGIEIRAGVIWRSVTNVPRSRVQHIDVTQGPLERQYGLGRLVIYTAGTSDSKVQLPGLTHHVALELRDRLLPGQTVDVI
jgi:membrane protein YdbS with pleckstrin-like domain